MSDEFRHLDCVGCRVCGAATVIGITQVLLLNGVRTRVREHVCSNTRCGDSYKTAEVPLEVANDVWECEP